MKLRLASGWGGLALMSVVIALGLACLAPLMAPIKRGNAEELWEQACHFQPREQVLGGHGHVYRPREGWLVYDIQHLHGSELYRVPEAEILESFDQVVDKLRVEDKNPDIYAHAHAAFERWFNCPDDSRRGPEGLLADIREAYLDSKTENPDIYSMHKFQEWLVEVRWVRSKWYLAGIAFEWVFLCGLLLFAVWPGLRGKGSRRWALHLAVLPMLFMLPAYLGYATFTFTSAGPSGGVLYPWLLFGLYGGRCNQVDDQILDHLPQVLEPLSAPIGMPMALSGKGMPGPTTMAIAGLAAAAAVFVIYKAWHFWTLKSGQEGANHNLVADR
jgi:hypothetical protein